jgi:hypothetical protein
MQGSYGWPGGKWGGLGRHDPAGGASVSRPTLKWKLADGLLAPPGTVARTLKVCGPLPTR